MTDGWFYVILIGIVMMLGLVLFRLVILQARGIVGGRWMPLTSLLFFFFLLSSLFLGAETYYRCFYDGTDSFAFTKVTQRWFQRYYRFNGMGVRDNVEYYWERLPGVPRVTFLGDSFAAGHGIKNVEDRFANIIRREEAGRWEVHVFASNGLDTGDEMLLLDGALKRRYQMDRVVLVYCLNDVADISPEWKNVWTRIVQYQNAGKNNFFVKNSYCVNTWYYRLSAMRDPDISNYYKFVKEGYEGAIWERQKERLAMLRDMVEEHGGHLLVVTFPFFHQMGTNYEYRPVHKKLREFWEDLGVPALDLLDIYKDYPSQKIAVSRFDAHPNEFAHKLAAEAIVNFLESQIRPSGSPWVIPGLIPGTPITVVK